MIATESGLRVIPFEPAHYRVLGRALFGAWAEPDKIEEIALGYQRDGPAWTVLAEDDHVLLVAGVTLIWPGRGRAWACLDRSRLPGGAGIGRALHYLVASHLGRVERDHRLRVITADAQAADQQAGRWLKALRFRDCCTILKYGPEGEPFTIWARHPR